jgi:hypothetical protein
LPFNNPKEKAMQNKMTVQRKTDLVDGTSTYRPPDIQHITQLLAPIMQPQESAERLVQWDGLKKHDHVKVTMKVDGQELHYEHNRGFERDRPTYKRETWIGKTEGSAASHDSSVKAVLLLFALVGLTTLVGFLVHALVK